MLFGEGFELRPPDEFVTELGEVCLGEIRIAEADALAGNAFDGPPRLSELRVGLGLEVRLSLQLGYTSGGSLRAGFAKGVVNGGTDQVYLALGSSF